MYKGKKAFLYIAILIFLLCFIFSSYQIIIWLIDNNNTKAQIEEIKKETIIIEKEDNENTEIVNPPAEEDEESMPNDYRDYIKIPLIDVNFDELLKKNKDTAGWIQVNGTNINYPFVQTKDNDYYLTHSFNKSYNQAGWIFLDYRNDITDLNQNTIIYGHGRRDNTMFGTLKKITSSSWYQNTENHVVKISTPNENTLWQVFSVYVVPVETYYMTPTFYDDEEYTEFLNTMLERSIYDFNVTLNKDDKILTLSTCHDDDTKRVVLQAKLIKRERKS